MMILRRMSTLLRSQWISFYLLILSFVSYVFFLYGYFPIKYAGSSIASWDDLPTEVEGFGDVDPKKLYDKNDTSVVLMIIDALRYDFVNEHHMPYLSWLIADGQACLYKAHAAAPTVTMPRIKTLEKKLRWRWTTTKFIIHLAMTTGTIPTFADVALNFGAPAVRGDSVVRQVSRAAGNSSSRGAVLYGDDTWLRLYPGLWSKSDPTTSFYVSDYTEVDNNVTRHLTKELMPNSAGLPDFRLLVLHYLGLDHIGHLDGARSPKVKIKLAEMDDIIKNIFAGMNTWKDGSGTLVVCGDHGMRDAGGHGGGTPHETTVPIVVVRSSTEPRTMNKEHCYTGFQKEELQQSVHQVDVAPSLSVLLGMPFPSAALGRILPGFLPYITEPDKLIYALHYNMIKNVEQLERMVGKDRLQSLVVYSQYTRSLALYRQWLREGGKRLADLVILHYSEALKTMSEYLNEDITEFDVLILVLGASCQILCVYGLFLVLLYDFMPALFRNVAATVRFRYQSLFYPTVFWICIYFAACFYTGFQKGLCCVEDWTSAAVALCGLVLFVEVGVSVCIIRSEFISSVTNACKAYQKPGMFETLLVTGTILHSFTFAGTSFIEEEHQTWYFYWNSVAFLILIKVFGLLVRYWYNVSENSSEVREKPHLEKRMRQAGALLLPLWICLICLHRFLRTLNRTGDKWAHLPSFSDWLLAPENSSVLEWLMIASFTLTVLICVYSLKNTRDPYKINTILTILSSLCIFHYWSSTGELNFSMLPLVKTDSVLEVEIFWYLLAAISVVEILSFRGDFARTSAPNEKEEGNFLTADNRNLRYKDKLKKEMCKSLAQLGVNNLLLIVSLLIRPHNLILVPSLYFTLSLTSRVLAHDYNEKSKDCKNFILTKTLFHVWIGMLFYFYQGNSNCLSAVDLKSGYVGLSTYNPVWVAWRMGIHTFQGPSIAGMVLFRDLALSGEDLETKWRRAGGIICMTRMFQTAFMSIVAIILRNHLFVWTVVSPKLLYDFVAMVFAIIAIQTIVFISQFVLVYENVLLRKKNVAKAL